MNKVYLLVKEYYGDFDIHQIQPLSVSESKSTLDGIAERLNSARNQTEIGDCVKYSIYDKQLKVL